MGFEYLLGVVVSLIVEGVKKWLGTNILGTYTVLLVISLIGAAIYHFLADTIYWQSIVQILVTASAFHNLLLRRFEK